MKVYIILSCSDCNNVRVYSTRKAAEQAEKGFCATIIEAEVDTGQTSQQRDW